MPHFMSNLLYTLTTNSQVNQNKGIRAIRSTCLSIQVDGFAYLNVLVQGNWDKQEYKEQSAFDNLAVHLLRMPKLGLFHQPKQ